MEENELKKLGKYAKMNEKFANQNCQAENMNKQVVSEAKILILP